MSALFLKILRLRKLDCSGGSGTAVLPEKSAEMGKCAALGLCCRAADLPGFH